MSDQTMTMALKCYDAWHFWAADTDARCTCGAVTRVMVNDAVSAPVPRPDAPLRQRVEQLRELGDGEPLVWEAEKLLAEVESLTQALAHAQEEKDRALDRDSLGELIDACIASTACDGSTAGACATTLRKAVSAALLRVTEGPDAR